MSNYIKKNLKQRIVYWGSPTLDGFGKRTYSDPVEIKGRWEDRNELFINQAGLQEVSRAVVYVDQDVDLDGFLWLGDISELSSSEEGEPATVDGACIIKAFRKVPSLKANKFERKAWT